MADTYYELRHLGKLNEISLQNVWGSMVFGSRSFQERKMCTILAPEPRLLPRSAPLLHGSSVAEKLENLEIRVAWQTVSRTGAPRTPAKHATLARELCFETTRITPLTKCAPLSHGSPANSREVHHSRTGAPFQKGSKTSPNKMCTTLAWEPREIP